MSNENIPKDYDFKKKRFGSKNGKMRELYKFLGDGTKPRYIIDTPPTISNRFYSFRPCIELGLY